MSAVTSDSSSVEETPTNEYWLGDVLVMSEKAVKKALELLESESDANLALRIEVRPGGCSGFKYDLCFDDRTGEDDIEGELGGLRTVVARDSAELMRGARIDYEDGLNGAGFKISNPLATRSCGCGSSFC